MFIKQKGQGPALVMLHGWSMHSGVWHQFSDLLAEHFSLFLVDLPGHGQSDWQANALQMENLIQQLKQHVPEQAYWLGWSLGGLIAIAFSHRYPEAVKKLILFASSPCFVQKTDWSCAVESDVFEQFSASLDHDQQQTLKRFLMLQARGTEQSKTTIRQLAEQIAASNLPHPEALKQGLALLLSSDFRQKLITLDCPIQMIFGERDTLVPATALQQIKMICPEIETVLLKGAGHAPFIANPQLCNDYVTEFFNA